MVLSASRHLRVALLALLVVAITYPIVKKATCREPQEPAHTVN
jgi:hypothetical protein